VKHGSQGHVNIIGVETDWLTMCRQVKGVRYGMQDQLPVAKEDTFGITGSACGVKKRGNLVGPLLSGFRQDTML
jgi:hypothetical protein